MNHKLKRGRELAGLSILVTGAGRNSHDGRFTRFTSGLNWLWKNGGLSDKWSLGTNGDQFAQC